MAFNAGQGLPNGGPPRKGPQDEDEDYERNVQKMLDQKFDDWPNEAGLTPNCSVEGLTEVRGPIDLKVQGSIPSWAAGTLYRTGPGGFEVETAQNSTYRVSHWFDGFGQSHRFTIIPDENDDGTARVEYASRCQTEELVEEIRQNGKPLGFTFAQRQDPCIGMFGKMMTVWRMPFPKNGPRLDNISVTVQANVPGLGSSRASTEGQQPSAGQRATATNLWLTTDSCNLKEMDLQTLEPIGFAAQQKLHPLLKGPLSCAHAQRDPATGDLYNYNLDFGPVATYRVFRVNAATGTTDIIATIRQADAKPAYMHSFFLSESFVILCIPSTHLAAMGLHIPWQRNIVDAIEPFDESKACKWFVIDRRGGRGVVGTYESPAGFHFHSVNAFEEVEPETGDTLVYCDVVEYPSLDVIRSFELDVLMRRDGGAEAFWGDENRNRNTQSRFARHKLRVPSPFPAQMKTKNKGAGENSSSASKIRTTEKVLEIKAPRVGELPTINPAYATRRHRYFYSLPNRGHSTLLDGLGKTDLETRETVYWDNPRGHTPGEAIFVPRPPPPPSSSGRSSSGEEEDEEDEMEEMAEDDGVLLSVVLDGYGKNSYLLCLDARTMRELGRAECGWAIAHGFHGIHTQT
ncbi:carotenoid cleavage dioxygenase 1 [Apiospora phragmitis]|uniref:Carotenoid cleavage dioxygenase 1 n=1 Tax=Apiospora phragmitis TaxID=2905665 RepID=A0ABR1W6W8_9PEZI